MDKPAGLSSHDVVAVARRSLGRTRVGHAGTLDPFATGVLPLACGKATRLVRFMVGAEKTYETSIRFGLVTNTYDITGVETSRSDARPTLEAVGAAITAMSGEQMQTPPPFSAKHVEGRRAYELARKDIPVNLAPVKVRLRSVHILALTGDAVTVTLTCSSGFYVRSFAHDLGARLGVGACVQALRRTRSGQFTLAEAVTLDRMQDGRPESAMVPLAELLPELPGIQVSGAGRERLRHGQLIRPRDISGPPPSRLQPGLDPLATDQDWYRVLDEDGDLVAVSTRWDRDGALRPNIVLI